NWACSSFLNSAIQLNLNFCIINVFNKKNKKPLRGTERIVCMWYGAYCLAQDKTSLSLRRYCDVLSAQGRTSRSLYENKAYDVMPTAIWRTFHKRNVKPANLAVGYR
ncbi:MAG: hypothetical protein WAP46_06800, partial [Dysgonamonadaceae bacterium]